MFKPKNLRRLALNKRSGRPRLKACDAQNMGHNRPHAVGFPIRRLQVSPALHHLAKSPVAVVGACAQVGMAHGGGVDTPAHAGSAHLRKSAQVGLFLLILCGPLWQAMSCTATVGILADPGATPLLAAPWWTI